MRFGTHPLADTALNVQLSPNIDAVFALPLGAQAEEDASLLWHYFDRMPLISSADAAEGTGEGSGCWPAIVKEAVELTSPSVGKVRPNVVCALHNHVMGTACAAPLSLPNCQAAGRAGL